MSKDYSTFNASDFLNDDFFIESMLNPNVSSEVYWKTLINEEKIDCDEFLTAYMTLKNLKDNKPVVPMERIHLIWERIEQSKKQISKKQIHITKRKWFYYTAACIITGIAVLFFYTFYRKSVLESGHVLSDYTEYKTIHNQEQSADIQITTGNNTLAIDGMNADVKYDGEGNMKVNNQIITNTTNRQDNPVYSQLKVPYGKRAQITLSDSTVLWVNTGTTVIYPIAFTEEKREIYIEGEIYASVIHDERRPFIIKTKRIDVQVIGTELNVTAYNEDDKIDVVLVRGIVNVKLPKGEPASMQPNQCFTFSENEYKLHQVDVDHYTHWRKGSLILKSEPIENILLRLARYYNVTMKLPSSVSGISCSGKIELKENLNEVLDGLSEITSMRYSVRDDTYQFKFN